MVFDDIDISSLPANSQEAFVQFEKATRFAYEKLIHDDREYNVDHHGNYEGSYDPERSYVAAVLAFLDEYALEANIEDISALDDRDFYYHFQKFKAKIQYITARYGLRKNRIASGGIGTVIEIAQGYKAEIGEHLEKVRKIVNQEVEGGRKKDNIFSKIADLLSEVDRDQTTVDATFGLVLDLSKVIGEAAGNLKPAIDQLERVKKLFWDNSNKVEQLPKPDRPKMITKKEEPKGYDLDDTIPF